MAKTLNTQVSINLIGRRISISLNLKHLSCGPGIGYEHMHLYFIVVFYDLCVWLCVVAAEIELGPASPGRGWAEQAPAGPGLLSSFLNTDICSSWP